uniref:Uncharacterized protein n=1 Tax=Tanacetum cinerariifolium TaxID=118510 RepID=A0A699INR2_TANCI|nr:hypothetical protein [Tanacetum cinerariifolium]
MQWKNPSWIDTKRTYISSRSGCYCTHSMLSYISYHCRCPKVYMHQFWNSVFKHDTFYRFKLDKKKQFKLTLEVFRDIFQICLRVPGRNFDALPSEEDTMSFLRELGHTGEINSLNDIYEAILPECLTNLEMKESKVYKTYLGYATYKEPVTKGKRVKRSVKKSSTKPTTCIVIREPPIETKSKRKEKSHPSGSGTVSEKQPRVDKITPTVTSEGTGDKPGVFDVTEDDPTENGSELDSESDQQEYEEEVKDDDDDDDDKSEGDKDRGMDDTTNQFSDDVQDKKADVEMTDAQHEKENLNITQEQVVKDAHVTIMTVTKEYEVPDASFSHSSDLASKFLNFLDIHPNDAKLVSPLDVYVLHESKPTPPTIETTNIPSIIPNFTLVFRFNERVIVLEQDVVELKKDPLHTQVTALVDDHLDTILGATREEFVNFLSASLTDKITEKASSQPQSTYEAAATLTEFELKKILIDKINTSESYLIAPEHRECYDDEGPSAGSDRGFKKRKTRKYAEPTTGPKNKDSMSGSSKGTESQPKPSKRLFNQRNQSLRLKIQVRLKVKKRIWALLEKLDWENPEGDDYLFDLSKPLPLIMHRNRQSIPVEFFINNDLKYQKGGISTITYTMSTTKTKAAQYDLPGIKDMIEQRKSFYAYARGMQSRKDVYSTKRILAVTHVSVMRKHGYGYLEEIVVRRADNVLYRFKEGDDVADFALALRMFTRSLVIQKRVKDLQLRVEIYQKQINVTKHDTTRPDLKKDTLTLHTKTLKDSFMLLSSLKDITKNIDMEYLSNKRWSTLEKKRAYFMIKDINKLLKERRRMRSLEKLVGSRLYRTDLIMLQRTI